MKATDLLKGQHRDVDDLIARLERSEDSERGPLLERLASSLVAHSAIETGILYPSYLEEIGSDECMLESFEEHGLLSTCLHSLLSVSVADETFDAKLAVLKDLFRHHADEEEDDLFPELERSLAAPRVLELGREMAARYAECVEDGWKDKLAEAVADYVTPVLPSDVQFMARAAGGRTDRRS